MKNASAFLLSIFFAFSTLSAFPERAVKHVYNNPLTLNGHTLVPEQFSLASKGKLSLVIGNPELAAASKVLFTVRLKRDGKFVQAFGKTKPSAEMDISRILAFAKAGDELLVESAEADLNIVRIVKVKPYFPAPYFQWFGISKANNDRC